MTSAVPPLPPRPDDWTKPVTTASQTYSARPLSLEQDREVLLRLWRENMSDPRIGNVTAERFRWLYETNPNGPARTWLGLVDGERVIGCGSLLPRRMSVAGRQMQAGILSDFTVDRDHRVLGPAMVLQRRILSDCREAGFDLVFGWPNARAIGVMKRIGYATVGIAHSWIKPLRTGARLAPLIAERYSKYLPGWLTPERVARMGAPLLDRALAGRDLLMRANDLARTRVDLVDSIDDRVDLLWARAKNQLILGERNAAFLNWRYSRFTTERYRYALLSDRASHQLLGYLVFTMRGDTALIVDLFVDDIDRSMAPLVLGLTAELRAQSVGSLSLTYLGTPRFRAKLRSLGFFERGGDRPVIMWTTPGMPDDVRALLSNSANWFMLDGDLDI